MQAISSGQIALLRTLFSVLIAQVHAQPVIPRIIALTAKSGTLYWMTTLFACLAAVLARLVALRLQIANRVMNIIIFMDNLALVFAQSAFMAKTLTAIVRLAARPVLLAQEARHQTA